MHSEDTSALVLNIQRYSLDDGPGMRTTVFLKGCPLACLWCSNPESQDSMPQVIHRDSLCNQCGDCIPACPERAISFSDTGIRINRKLCTNCGKCTEVCRRDAIKIAGTKMTVEQVFQIVRKDRDYYEQGNWTYRGRQHRGGLTISGGECLSRIEFTSALLRRCSDEGIHTCIDTAGHAPLEDLKKVAPYTSLVLFDVKHADPVAHYKATKLSNRVILKNLEYLVSKSVPVVVRVPVIPAINDKEKDLEAIAELVAALDGEIHVHVMPYHKYGTEKYPMLDKRTPLKKFAALDEGRQQFAKSVFEAHGLTCFVIPH